MTKLFKDQLWIKIVVSFDIDQRYYPEELKATELVYVDRPEILEKLISCESCRVQKILELCYKEHSGGS